MWKPALPEHTTRRLRLAAALALLLGRGAAPSAQMVTLGTFDPPPPGPLCGIAYDAAADEVWVYPCWSEVVLGYGTDGTPRGTLPRPGEPANDTSLEFAPKALAFGTAVVPEGTLLFLNGETGPAEVYALDRGAGTVFDTLQTTFGNHHALGLGHHPFRSTFFLLQDHAGGPIGAQAANRIAELDPVSGDTLRSFVLPFRVTYGDVDVSLLTGNLFIINGGHSRITEYTPEGAFVRIHLLPAGTGNLTALALHCAADEAWATDAGGRVLHFGGIPCSAPSPAATRSSALADGGLRATPNPTGGPTILHFTLERPATVRLALYDALGREVAVPAAGPRDAGPQQAVVDTGRLAPGAYVARLRVGSETFARRVVVVR